LIDFYQRVAILLIEFYAIVVCVLKEHLVCAPIQRTTRQIHTFAVFHSAIRFLRVIAYIITKTSDAFVQKRQLSFVKDFTIGQIGQDLAILGNFLR
jgi:hypothetical protein